MAGSDSLNWYNTHAADLAAGYERLSFETVHEWLLDLIPEDPGLALDVGAGSGRDAAALADRGFEVVAIDGKTVRRSGDKKGRTGAKAAIHMVSAFAARQRLVLGQVNVAEKSNEIVAIPKLR